VSHHHRFPAEPWVVRETELDLGALAEAESLFALCNGHIGLRGTLDEGDPAGLPGTYLNSFYETRPLPYAEAGYGYPETGQTVVNVTNGKLIRLVVDDEPFDVRYGIVHHHERTLDLREGVLHRDVVWESPSGQQVAIHTTRLVSLSQRAIAAVHYEVKPIDASARIVVQSELVANEHVPPQSRDPRVAAMMESPLEAVEADGVDRRAWLLHHTRSSGLRVAAAMDHHFEDRPGARLIEKLLVHPDWARLTAGTVLQADETMSFTKFIAYGWSSQRSTPALRDQVDAALVCATYSGWPQLLEEQREAMAAFWAGADVSIEGDPAVQQAVRFALFHTYQNAARAEHRAIPAKGLTGPGYDGHAFWDTEMFVLPVLSATAPQAAADALVWRRTTMDLATDRAKTMKLTGTAFPWRTIRGQETSGYWPAGTAALHVNADIASAAMRHVRWTADAAFDRDTALPLLVGTARLWTSVGYHGNDGKFHIDGITGPDEYSAIVDDNIYTNLMAKANLTGAADAAERWRENAAELGVDRDEIAAWRVAAESMAVPFDEVRDVHSQDKDFTSHDLWDFEASADAGGYPLLLNAPYFDIYRKQVVKQADLVLALHWCGEAFSFEQKCKAFDYYEPLTVRDSSLSACTQAVIAAEVGHLDLAGDYLAEAALMDLRDLEHNTRDGLHIASLAGTWLAVVAGFGGMRDNDEVICFHPQLPPKWASYEFRLRWRGARIRVQVTGDGVTYGVEDGDRDITIVDCGEPITITSGSPLQRPLQPVKALTPRPTQPKGREPINVDGLDEAIRD
jgi:alpha,alpha-trehalose phosphorylase